MLFMYPSHVVSMKAVVLRRQSGFSNLMQTASMMLQVKKGTQQIRKTPEAEAAGEKRERKLDEIKKSTREIYGSRNREM